MVIGDLTWDMVSWKHLVASLSKQVDSVALGRTSCFNTLDATALSMQEAAKLRQMTIPVPHSVITLMDEGAPLGIQPVDKSVSGAFMPNLCIALVTVNTLHPATLLSADPGDLLYDCGNWG